MRACPVCWAVIDSRLTINKQSELSSLCKGGDDRPGLTSTVRFQKNGRAAHSMTTIAPAPPVRVQVSPARRLILRQRHNIPALAIVACRSAARGYPSGRHVSGGRVSTFPNPAAAALRFSSSGPSDHGSLTRGSGRRYSRSPLQMRRRLHRTGLDPISTKLTVWHSAVSDSCLQSKLGSNE